MSRRAAALAALFLLPLGACGSGGSTDTAAATTNNAGGDYIAQMARLNEKERNVALFRAISDAGRACQGVTRSAPYDAVRGKPAWIATCDDGTPWLVTLDDRGTATVTAVAPNPTKAG